MSRGNPCALMRMEPALATRILTTRTRACSLSTFAWGCMVFSGNPDLTSKEWAIAALLSQGSTNAQIATSIHVSEPLVKDHLRSILQKTGCWNRTEIALWYLKMGVEQERRFSDRRVPDSETSDERRKGRRRPQERGRRANEQHDIKMDE
jgi:DNA-binding CsgD family transcriptional regulator